MQVGSVYDWVVQNSPACNGFCETHSWHMHSGVIKVRARPFPAAEQRLAGKAPHIALDSGLVKLRSSVTLCTTACCEPSLDYVVAKVPRWDLREVSTVDTGFRSCVKSVGEVMAIGRTL